MAYSFDYAAQEAYLSRNPHEIVRQWLDNVGLFAFTTKDGVPPTPGAFHGEPMVGCITQVKSLSHIAPTPELTAAIRADERIPAMAGDITVDHLPIFREWQERIDRELRNKPITEGEPCAEPAVDNTEESVG